MATRDPRRLQHWQTIIANWRNSGRSVTAFCRSLGVNKSGFHRWRNIIEQLERDNNTPTPSPHPDTAGSAFVPLRVIPDPVVEVILPSGLQLRVPLAADPQQLARLVQALGETPC